MNKNLTLLQSKRCGQSSTGDVKASWKSITSSSCNIILPSNYPSDLNCIILKQKDKGQARVLNALTEKLAFQIGLHQEQFNPGRGNSTQKACQKRARTLTVPLCGRKLMCTSQSGYREKKLEGQAQVRVRRTILPCQELQALFQKKLTDICLEKRCNTV